MKRIRNSDAITRFLQRLVTRLSVAWASSRRGRTQAWYDEAVEAYYDAREYVDEEGYLDESFGDSEGSQHQEPAVDDIAVTILAGRLRTALVRWLRRPPRLVEVLGICRLIERADWRPAAETLMKHADERDRLAGNTTLPVYLKSIAGQLGPK